MWSPELDAVLQARLTHSSSYNLPLEDRFPEDLSSYSQYSTLKVDLFNGLCLGSDRGSMMGK